MKRTTISLPDDLAMLLEEEARHRQTSVSEVVRHAIQVTLVGAGRRSLPFAGVCDDPAMISGDTMESALAEGWARDLARGRR
jgi:hypothetical protein